jgi:hypothetical protein
MFSIFVFFSTACSMIQTAPAEVTKHILSYIDCHRTKYRLFYATKLLRKYLPKKLLSHRLQGNVLGIFGGLGGDVIFDSPIVVGVSRFWSFMDKYEQSRFKDWIQRYKENQGVTISLFDDGMRFTSCYNYTSMQVPRLFAPYPREIFIRSIQ